MKKIIPLVAAVAVAVTAAGGYALAEKNGDDAAERAAIASASVTLSQAIQAAEAKTGGKAIESGVENEDGKILGYDVEVRLADGSVKKVIVDMKSGQVVKVMADDEDQDDDRDDDRKN